MGGFLATHHPCTETFLRAALPTARVFTSMDAQYGAAVGYSQVHVAWKKGHVIDKNQINELRLRRSPRSNLAMRRSAILPNAM
jgi:hypothetical protein